MVEYELDCESSADLHGVAHVDESYDGQSAHQLRKQNNKSNTDHSKMKLAQLRLELPISLLLNLLLKSIDPGEDLYGLDVLETFSEHADAFLLSLHALFLEFCIFPLDEQVDY